VINYFKKFQLYRQNGPNLRCVTPSSDHFGGILNKPIDLDLYFPTENFYMTCSSTQQRRLRGKTPPRLGHLAPASKVTRGPTLPF
jgi:hypothetical protein